MASKKQKSFYEFPRPMDNDTLVGHFDVMKTFLTAWNNRDAHPIHPVWILSGTHGIGKATLAHKIAKMVVGNASDFFVIDMERNIDKDGKPKTDGKVISVYTVRKMIEQMQLSSSSGGWRVIVIDSVDELNAAASNAMLKLLEEPPAKTLFLLVVHQLSNVLPTIRSRARVEKMTPLSVSQLRELCIKFIPDEEISTTMLHLRNGSFGKIANIKINGGDEIYDDLISALENPRSTASDMMGIAKKIATAPALHGLLLDAIRQFGLADLYPSATRAIADINSIHLEPEIAIFKIIMEIKNGKRN
jgi:DNA polymerase-3 subunit delta'